VETDAQEVVNVIKNNAYDNSTVGHLIEEIMSLLSLNFLCFGCVYVRRDCNRAAHELAVLGHLCTEGRDSF